MPSLRSTAKLLDPVSQVISMRKLAQIVSLQPPISLCRLNELGMLYRSEWDNYKVEDVEQALNLVNKSGKLYFLKGKCNGLPIPHIPLIGSEAHVQGVASYKDYFIITHNSESGSAKTGSIVVLNQNSLKIVNKMNTPEGYNHPGGIQQIGNYLAVSLESKDESIKDSFIRFYDLRQLSNTQLPILLEKPSIYRTNKKAGSVGITTYKENGIDKFILAVHDNGSVDFYKSNGKLLSDPLCNFDFVFNCNITSADNLCLVTDKQEKIYMIGFRSTADKIGLPVVDYADLYLIDMNTMNVNPKTSNIHFICNHGPLIPGVGVHFRWGAGIRIVSSSKIEVLATQRNFVPPVILYPPQREIGINIFYS
ncbi:MAG: hypothetical protein ACPK85_08930 [Methanosarcina sp.]